MLPLDDQLIAALRALPTMPYAGCSVRGNRTLDGQLRTWARFQEGADTTPLAASGAVHSVRQGHPGGSPLTYPGTADGACVSVPAAG